MKTTFRGRLFGIYVLEKRLINVAPEATFISSSNQELTKHLTDHRRGGWHDVWENEWKDRGKEVSGEDPESFLLLWPGWRTT